MNQQQNASAFEKLVRERKAKDPIKDDVILKITSGAQPGIKNMLYGKEVIEKAHMAISWWILDKCIPFNALQSLYYHSDLDAFAMIGNEYKGPSYKDMRIHLLANCKKDC